MSIVPPPPTEIIEQIVRSLDEIIAATTDLKAAIEPPEIQQHCEMARYYLKEGLDHLITAHFRLFVPVAPGKE